MSSTPDGAPQADVAEDRQLTKLITRKLMPLLVVAYIISFIDRTNIGLVKSTVDAEGGLWNALVYDGRIVRFAPDGTVDRVIDMPVKKVTSVMFGGPDLDILYVTSMAQPPQPRFPGDPVAAGSLFTVTGLGVTGVPEPRFGA